MIIHIRRYLPIFIITLLALTLRLYHIYDFAEFKGDQGRDAIIIFEHWHDGTLPILGPRTSTGQFPGPFFFYLIGLPLVLGNFNPVAPTVFVTILEGLTVIPLWYLLRRIISKSIATSIVLLYALSPGVLAQTRVFWNPTTVPFFTALLFLLYIYYWETKRAGEALLIGIVTGILVQLHAAAYVYVPVSLLIMGVATAYPFRKYTSKHKNTNVHTGIRILKSMSIGIVGISMPLAPYLWHEVTHGFINIRGIVSVAQTPEHGIITTNILLADIFNIVNRLMLPIIYVPYMSATIGVIILATGTILVARNIWGIFFTVLLTGGILILTTLQGTTPDHYLSFIFIIPFIIVGIFLHIMQQRFGTHVPYGYIAVALITILISLPSQFSPSHDIAKTIWAVETMKTEAENIPFAFVQFASTSASDLHYRYYFLIKNITVEPYETGTFDTLFVICDSATCRTDNEIATARIKAMCYEKYCDREYPYVELTDWQFVKRFQNTNITLYQFTRS